MRTSFTVFCEKCTDCGKLITSRDSVYECDGCGKSYEKITQIRNRKVADGLIVAGATGTNVNDVAVLVIKRQ